VFVHDPDRRRSSGGGGRGVLKGRAEALSSQGDVSLLNINEVIGCLSAGRLSPAANAPHADRSHGDTLVVGTQTNLLGYDVANNQDIFYKEVHTACTAVHCDSMLYSE